MSNKLTKYFISGLMSIAFAFGSGLQISAQNVEALSQDDLQLSEKKVYDEGKPSKQIAPDSGNLITSTTYAFAAGTAALEDMSSDTTLLVAAGLDDTASAVTNIGFDFYYDGVRYTQFSCNANGLCRLGGTIVTTSFDNGSATTGFATVTNAPKIAPYYDDLWVGTNGKVHSKVTGAAGSRKLVVEWQNMTIPRQAAATTGAGTFQMWLNESTGIIQFVYGNGIVANTANAGYTIGLQAGAATNFASVTNAGATVSYTTHNATQTNAIDAGTSYTFTPNIPAAPTGLNFTGVNAIGLTLNWTDVATNEFGYVVYRSADDVTYSPVSAVLPAGTTTFTDSGLSPNTNYFYRVYAVSEGALSSSLAGSQTTAPTGNISAVAAGGNWSNTATWVGGVIPSSSDIVTIPNGAIVTIDTAASAYAVNVGTSVSSSELGVLGGVLRFEDATARTLTVVNDVTINPAGILQSANSGTVTTHNLSIGGNLTNNGTLDFSTNADTAGAGITFTGVTDASFSGSGVVTDVRTITINKGTSSVSILELSPANFTVQGVNTDGAGAGFLTLTNGTLKISGTFTGTYRTFATAAYTIPATAGFWMNNPNYTVAGQNASSTLSGLFRMTQGTFNIGTATGNSMAFTANSRITVEGGAINATGRFGVTAAATAITYNQTGGTITVCTVGNTSTALASFDMGTSTASFVAISGGTIVVQLANTAATTPRDYRLQAGSATTSAGIASVTGGTLQLGNAQSGAARAFNLAGVAPNVVLDTAVAGHSATWGAAVTWNNIALNITIGNGTTMNFGNQVFLMNGATLTNNGTLTHNGASSRFIWFLANLPQTYTGTGTVTAPMTSFEAQNGNVILDPSVQNLTVRRVIIFVGNIINSNKLTVGNNDATVSNIQIGNTTTPTAAGTFDSAPTFNLGSGGLNISYLRTAMSYTTGPEIPPSRTLVNLTFDDNDPSHTFTLAGGNLTVGGTLALTNGVVNAGSNVLTHNGTVTRTAGYVNGTIARNYTATGSYIYHVGANGYSPLNATITTLTTNPSTLSVKPTDDTLPGLTAATAVSRYWTITETGDLTADLVFTYLDADVNGNEANYKVFKREGGVTAEVTPSTINAAANTATVTGVTNFSDWGIGETLAPTVPFGDISGTVTSGINALNNVVVSISNGQGLNLSTRTNAFGRYSFGDLPTGVNYTITVTTPRYQFTPSSQTVLLLGDSTNDFSATGESLVENEKSNGLNPKSKRP